MQISPPRRDKEPPSQNIKLGKNYQITVWPFISVAFTL